MTNRGARGGAALAIVAAIAALAIGCGSSTPTNNSNASQSNSGGTTPASVASGNADVTIAPSGKPKSGGKLVYGLEADTDGFDVVTARWSASGLIMANAVFDPLAAYDAQGVAKPYLAEKIEPSADYKTWTIKLRPDVTFHNGEKLTSDTVIEHLTRLRESPLTGPAAEPMDKSNVATKVDDLTLEVHMTTPWVSFPTSLTGQGGMVPAKEVMDNPDIETRRTKPIGTGPFKFQVWDEGKRFSATKNENYWRKGLPYLKEVEFRPLPDAFTRVNELENGGVNLLFTTILDQMNRIADLAKQGRAQIINDNGEQEELSLMLNQGRAPMNDVRIRKAVAYAVDLDAYSKAARDDPKWQTDGVFSPTSPWYVKTNFPRDDVAQAKQLVEEYEKEKGPVTATMIVSNTPDSLAVGQSVADMLNAVGMDVKVQAYDQSALITEALFGRYDLAYWRQFGSPDPDGDYVWWHSSNAVEPGEGRLGLNFARLKDPEIDAALDKARQNADVNVRKDAYATLQKRFSELVPYVWLDISVKVIGADPTVRDILNGPLPDGSPSMPITGGVTRMTQVWIDQ